MRKPVLVVDDSKECQKAKELLDKEHIPYVLYNLADVKDGCCPDDSIKAPTIYAPEGIFKGLEGVKEYIKVAKENADKESESAYW